MAEIRSVFKGISLSFLLFAVFLVFMRVNLSRYVLLFSYIFSLILVVVERSILYHILPLTKADGGWKKKILIYGAGELGAALFRTITNSPRLGIFPVGFIDDNPDKADTIHRSSGFSHFACTLSVLGTGDDIGELIKRHHIDEICVAISNVSNETNAKILERLRKENIKTSFVPNLYKVLIHKVNIKHVGRIPIVVEDEGEVGKAYLILKSCLGILMSTILMILLAPVFLVVSAAIKIDSKGSAFFKQKRVGMNGGLFEIYKFAP